MAPRHFLDIEDLSQQELADILTLSDIDPSLDSPIPREKRALVGKGVALLFEKASLRTRHSMEIAIVHHGGYPISVSASEMGIGLREQAGDIAQTLAGYHCAIGARVFSHATLTEMAEASPVPVFNLLSDKAHPFQALADLLTVKQTFKKLEGIKLAYIGDANNVAYSLAQACQKTGVRFHIAHPQGYGFAENIQSVPEGIAITSDPDSAVESADVVYTDVWTSMGQEAESKKRLKDFKGFCVTSELMEKAAQGAVFLHCLPAHRNEEVTPEVIDGPQSRVWQQARNRMFTAMGYFLWMAKSQEGGI